MQQLQVAAAIAQQSVIRERARFITRFIPQVCFVYVFCFALLKTLGELLQKLHSIWETLALDS